MDGHFELLRRIAVLLLALARLAERAGSRSRPVRCLVLLVLRRAEVAASAFAADVAPLAPVPPRPSGAGDGPDEAARLAGRLRALAAVFLALADRPRRPGWRAARRGRRISAGGRANDRAASPPGYADSS